MMSELPEWLCGRKEEFLAFADRLNQSDEYVYIKEAASLYHQCGKEEKYIAFLETHLWKKGKTYAALVDCYQRQGNIDGARKTARLGLEQCRDELDPAVESEAGQSTETEQPQQPQPKE